MGKKDKQPKVKATPEYIAEQKRLAALRRLEKAQNSAAGKAETETATKEEPQEKPEFITRELLWLGGEAGASSNDKSHEVRIMTYNMLAQCLIRRTLFPTSGEALKWNRRSQALLAELEHYDCDVMCLQEVDHVQYFSFWKSTFEKMGFHSIFHRFEGKNHGVAVVYRKAMFREAVTVHAIDYDAENETIEPQMATKNAGIIVQLAFANKNTDSDSDSDRIAEGLVVGTHHLWWHPVGTWERTRQTFVTAKIVAQFLQKHALNSKRWPFFFCGDFNSEPFDTPYLSLTRKPVYYDERELEVLKHAIRCIGRENVKAEERDLMPDSGIDVEFKVQQLVNAHNAVPVRAISAYSAAYAQLHAANSGYRHEPSFSNWAHTWRGLLDYILVMVPWDATESCIEPETVHGLFERTHGVVRLKALLRMPEREEMSEYGQPHLGEYASDHLCMVGVFDIM